jgi:tRNA 5-methylaminomethyl-2-thiouridine biosynthesis bifunctional protein
LRKGLEILDTYLFRRTAITIQSAQINWLDTGEPYSERFEDVYFSSDDGFIETEYVFLNHNNLPHRFAVQDNTSKDQVFRIAETGFGTGLNFLVSVYHWLQLTGSKRKVEYISVEKFPLDKAQLIRAYQLFCKKWPQLSPVCDAFLPLYPETFVTKTPVHEFEFFAGQIKLILLINEASAGLQSVLATHKKSMDAWYLDGFAPAKNPQMWTPDLFQLMFELSHPGTTLSTFTAAGMVRRGLTEAGFSISKAPGFGKKRELLHGRMV